MTAEPPTSKDSSPDQADIESQADDLDPQARSLIVSGPIGFQGKGLPANERKRIFDDLFFEDERRGPYLKRFVVLIVLSALIAALGLVNDSAAVVIGAMLVAPLMTPMLGSAAAIVEGWPRRFVETFAIVIFGALMAIAVGFIVAVVLPRMQDGSPLAGEIVARTAPNLVDLGIALAAGAAGAYIMVRSEASSALPGVGIAVALVPPLATVGITAGVGERDLAFGALLLFVTNLLAIVLAAGLTFAIAGFGAYRSARVKAEGILAGAVLVTLLIVIAIPLALNAIETYGQSEQNRVAAGVIEEWDPTLTIDRLVVNPTRDPMRVTVELSGEAGDKRPELLASLLAERLGNRIDLALSFQPVYRGLSPDDEPA
jgi:uncharacterized hydrophobic protein (TIGR00271 family)